MFCHDLFILPTYAYLFSSFLAYSYPHIQPHFPTCPTSCCCQPVHTSLGLTLVIEWLVIGWLVIWQAGTSSPQLYQSPVLSPTLISCSPAFFLRLVFMSFWSSSSLLSKLPASAFAVGEQCLSQAHSDTQPCLPVLSPIPHLYMFNKSHIQPTARICCPYI